MTNWTLHMWTSTIFLQLSSATWAIIDYRFVLFAEPRLQILITFASMILLMAFVASLLLTEVTLPPFKDVVTLWPRAVKVFFILHDQ